MNDERIAAFINSLDVGNVPYLNELEACAKKTNVPIVRKETQSLLKFLLAVKKPERILEIGTAIGFSALFMSEYGPAGCQITTIENYEKRIVLAKENFKKNKKEESIRLIEGDAAKILETLSEPYDFIFMDAAKGQYIRFLPHCLRLLKVDGFLVSDNVLQDGMLLESRFAVTRRDRTIHARMREYLYAVKHNETLETAVLPLGDGVSVSVKRR